jgi:hypothetical protein
MYIIYLPAHIYRTTTTTIATTITPLIILKSGWDTTYNTISCQSVPSPHPRSPGTVQRRYEILASEYHRTATHRYSTLAPPLLSCRGLYPLQQLPTLPTVPRSERQPGNWTFVDPARALRCTVRRRADLLKDARMAHRALHLCGEQQGQFCNFN